MSEVKRLLSQARLVTLLGSGGAGKTRLAIQVAADLLEAYPDGVWLVELAPITEPALVAQTVASTLELREPARAASEALVDFLRPKSLLLILDNCEHVLSASADLSAQLLRLCPSVRILATTRETLAVPGEVTYRVPSLTLPEPQQTSSPETVNQYTAVRLFVERAMLVHPAFQVTTSNVRAIAEVCRRLDGIPLAIELAAARVKVLSVEQIAARLEDRFRLLTGGTRTGLPHHQTLRAAMDWSYDLLPEGERALFRRLAVFAGSFSLEAAERVCADDGIAEAAVLDLLTHLVDKSLVLTEDSAAGEVRYQQLETVRQYALNRLVESGETEA
ncbi:MAG TPA: NB-ARC domain-containing protein, partial [bacterium]|nr:NB-ARC domain-containing protein [bacterium]